MKPRTQIIIGVTVLVIAITAAPIIGEVATEPTPAVSTQPTAAQTVLNLLTIDTPHPMTGYSRDRFPHWRSTGPGCDVRDAILEHDGTNITYNGCDVTGGTWYSWYDGKTLTAPSQVDIDHMVPLANAWRSGADKWTDEVRGNFANDQGRPQLFAVSASSNRSKGDQDPSNWKPPDAKAWCPYAQDWITVKAYWHLSITQPEHDALQTMLETCP